MKLKVDDNYKLVSTGEIFWVESFDGSTIQLNSTTHGYMSVTYAYFQKNFRKVSK